MVMQQRRRATEKRKPPAHAARIKLVNETIRRQDLRVAFEHIVAPITG
jgi:hypothetical protein